MKEQEILKKRLLSNGMPEEMVQRAIDAWVFLLAEANVSEVLAMCPKINGTPSTEYAFFQGFVAGHKGGSSLQLMKSFCPKCHKECLVARDTAKSLCCDVPAYVGCDTCGKRLIELRMLVCVDPSRLDRSPVVCYRCQKKATEKQKQKGAREWAEGLSA